MNCPNCGAQMQPGPIRGQKRCRYCETIVDERLRASEVPEKTGPFGLFADSDQDGTPDFVEMSSSMSHTQVETSYEINGKRYASLEEMPEEYRKLFPAVGSMVEAAPPLMGQRVERTESRAAWSPRELERTESRSSWLKPFVLGMLAALLLGWLLFG
ncbi:MAG: hypothetical protein ACYTG3_09165 [Planctomycetota bacterium]